MSRDKKTSTTQGTTLEANTLIIDSGRGIPYGHCPPRSVGTQQRKVDSTVRLLL